jgi:hypothetical protein
MGLDADANAATCGAILGARGGLKALPEDLRAIGGESFRSAVVGAENWRIPRLAGAIAALSEAMQFDPAEEWR